MARKFYTIFILPHAHARFRKIHLSRNFVVVVAVALGAVLVSGLLTPHLLLRLHAQSLEVARLEVEREQLQADRQRFEASLADMGERLARFESEARRLASALGIEDLISLAPASGGGSERAYGRGVQGLLDEEMDALRHRATSLEQSMERLADSWRQREVLLASTPSVMPVQGWFSDGYGWRVDPITGTREFHGGIDIVAPVGAVIRAPADAVVIQAGRAAGYGKMVELSHGYGYRTRYGHLSEIFVHPGQRIRRGDSLGRIGSTGRSTGPHLHYEVLRDGRRVNPAGYLGHRQR
jgi:murein DD-endopeptidase MepM/ murein hydrolase activator NlpD